MAQARFYSSVAPKTALTGTINASVTTLVVATATGFPGSLPFTLILERDTANEEVVTVTAVSGTTFTISRAQDGTTGVTHTTGAVVEHGVSARDFSEPQAHIGASSAVHGITGSVVGTTDTQTLTGKTLTAPVISTITNTGTLTLPTTTDTLVGRATADTLTNKTLNAATLDAASTVGGVSGTTLAADHAAWTAFTPALNNQSLGTGGSAVGAYLHIGKTVHFRAVFTFGTAPGTPSSSVWVSAAALPVPTAVADGACVGIHGGGSDFAPSNSMAITGRIRTIVSAFGANLFRSNTDAEISAANANYSPASGDVLVVSGTYEAA